MLNVSANIKLGLMTILLALSFNSWAAQENPQSFAFQGRIKSGTTAMTGVVSITIGILDPTEKCFLYEESFSSVDVTDGGIFAIKAGSGTLTANSPDAAAFGGTFTFAKVFANDGTTLGTGPSPLKSVPGNTCPGTYTSTSGELRYMRVVVNSTVMSPNITINSIPQALVAETLNGFGPSDIIKITNANFSTLTNGSDASSLHNHDSVYLKIGATGDVNLGSGSTYTSGRLSVGNGTAPNGTSPQVLIQNATATNQGLVITGANGQTANLAEFQNSTGTVLAKIDTTGKVYGDGSLLTGVTGTDTTKVAKAGDSMTGALTVSIASGTGGVAGTSAGALGKGIEGIADSGFAVFGTSSSSYGVYGTTATGSAAEFYTTGNSSNPVVTIQGGTSTGNLTEWTNNAGTILARVDKDGNFYGDFSGVINLRNFASWTTAGRPSGPATGTTGFNTDTGYLESYTGAAWVDYSAGTSTGNVSSNSANTFTVGNQAINISNAAQTGLSISGASGQTAALQKWTNDTGTVLASVNASGQFTGDGSLLTGIVASTMGALANNPTDCGANQYATTIDASGNLTCAQVDLSNLSGTSNVVMKNAANTFTNLNQKIAITNTTDVGLTIKGASGQTADLFTIKNTGGTVLISVDASGTISGPGITSGTSSTASKLATDPADCGANQFATTIAANGDLTCVQPTFAYISNFISSGQLPANVGKTDSANTFALGGNSITGASVFIKSWGFNSSYQLGTGNTTSTNSPVTTLSTLQHIKDIFTGGNHSCALLASGSIYCWGNNGAGGMLGNNSTTQSATPVAVSGISNAIAISGGSGPQTCAILSDNTAKCWGYNTEGQLGNNSTTNSKTPVAVSGLANAIQISTSDYGHTCALLSTGAVKCWGYNFYGQLGDGTTTRSLVPVDVAGLANVVQIATAYNSTCALLNSGSIKCWGHNSGGQLGNGNTTNQSSPVSVLNIANAYKIQGGDYHYCALLTDATMKCWGKNYAGGLGDGTIVDKSTPVAVSGISNVRQIAVGQGFSCALLNTGSVKCWGYGTDGTLGNGVYGDSTAPVDVTGITNAQNIKTGPILQVFAWNSDVPNLTIAGASGQSANLLNFNNSTGTVLSSFGADGRLNLTTWTTGTRPSSPVSGVTGFNTTTGYTETYTGSTWVNYSAASGVGGDLKSDGTVPMTANFNLGNNKMINVTDPTNPQDGATKNYTDTTFAKLAAANTFTVGQQIINIGAAAQVGLTVKGAASQTGNLAEFKNNDGTVLYSVEPTGSVTATTDVTSKVYVDTVGTNNGSLYVKKDGTIAMTGALNMGTHKITNVTDPSSAQDLATQNYTSTNAAKLSVANTFSVGGHVLTNAASTDVGLTIKGAASQSGNLLSFTNFGGTVLSAFDSTGAFTGSGAGNSMTADAFAADPTDCGTNQFATTIAANGNLTCAQPTFSNLSGSAGAAQLPSTVVKKDTANTFTSGTQTINIATASDVGLTVQGASGQTSNLMEWKNFGGTVLAYINANGQMVGNGSLLTGISLTSGSAFTSDPTDCSTGQYATTIAANGNLTCSTPTFANLTGTASNTQAATLARTDAANSFTTGGQSINIATASDVGLAVKGASGQSANIMEWKNSTGTVQVYINSAGKWGGSAAGLTNVPAGSVSWNTPNTFTVGNQVINIGTDAIGLTVAANYTQTANIQEWKNFGGTVLTSINSGYRLLPPSVTATATGSTNALTGTADTGNGIWGLSDTSNSGFFQATAGQNNTASTFLIQQESTQPTPTSLFEVQGSSSSAKAKVQGDGTFTTTKLRFTPSANTVDLVLGSGLTSVNYIFPANASGYLTTDGSGNLSWSSAPTLRTPWIPIQFGDSGLTATASNQLQTVGSSVAPVVIPFNAHLVGISCRAHTAVTGGTAQFWYTINNAGPAPWGCNGAIGANYCQLDTSNQSANLTGINIAITAGQPLAACVKTASFGPTTADVTVTYWITRD